VFAGSLRLELFADVIQTLLPHSLLHSLYLLVSALVVISLVTAGMQLFRQLLHYRWGWLALAGLLGLFAALFYPLIHKVPSTQTLNHKMPNIIIIGIDSLRPQDLPNTPHIAHFLHAATQFDQAYTPLGRTFPAWVSILTGEYPRHNGARYDLIKPSFVKREASLAFTLSKQGYHTIYASDETRFSNIDKHYGFAQVLTPAMGFNDFLLGTYNDFPLSNLLSNTRLGRWLFPYNYANRGDNVIYQPNTFVHFVANHISASKQPVFLALHFCLSHWPYAWAKTPRADYPARSMKALRKQYLRAIVRVDSQFQHLMIRLQEKGLLQHSIVIILSDHGETLGLKGSRITTKANYVNTRTVTRPQFVNYLHQRHMALDKSTGHGTDVLSLNQYHIVLAIRTRGLTPNVQSHIHFAVSLVDLKPTVLNLLHQPQETTDGISLAAYLYHPKAKAPPARELFLSTGFTPNLANAHNLSFTHFLRFALQYYQLVPATGRVIVQPEQGLKIIAQKEYAVLYKHWLLALYPDNGRKIQVLVNLQTHKWTDQIDSAFSQASPAQRMLTDLQHFIAPTRPPRRHPTA